MKSPRMDERRVLPPPYEGLESGAPLPSTLLGLLLAVACPALGAYLAVRWNVPGWGAGWHGKSAFLPFLLKVLYMWIFVCPVTMPFVLRRKLTDAMVGPMVILTLLATVLLDFGYFLFRAGQASQLGFGLELVRSAARVFWARPVAHVAALAGMLLLSLIGVVQSIGATQRTDPTGEGHGRD